MPMFGRQQPRSLEEIMASIQAQRQDPSQMMGQGPAQISPEALQFLQQHGQMPTQPGGMPTGPNPQLSPEDLERLRAGAQPRYHGPTGPIGSNPYMRPM